MAKGSKKVAGVCLVTLLGLTGLSGVAEAAEARIFAAGGLTRVPVKSLAERKFDSVIRQFFDFSCGSAALATLLTYHYDRPLTEAEVFDAMWAVGDQENIRRLGFSLLDMKLYLESVGLRADGFRVPLDKLREVGVPTIVLISRNGYTHFVVLRGIADRYVVLGDPALGALTVPREDFEEQWNGVALAIHNDTRVARASFNLERDLPLERRAFLRLALDRSNLAQITVLLPSSETEF